MQVEWSCETCKTRGAVEVVASGPIIGPRIVTDHFLRSRSCPQPRLVCFGGAGLGEVYGYRPPKGP
jgi:hypothetical protein